MTRVGLVAAAWIVLCAGDAGADRKEAPAAKRLKSVKTRAVQADAPAPADVDGKGAGTAPAPKPLDFSRATSRDDEALDEKQAEQRRQLIQDLDKLLAKAGPKYGARAERLWQKAELEWEEARWRHGRALAAHDPSSGKPEPRPDYTDAIATWRRILADHPEFASADEVRFHLGFALAEAANSIDAIATLEELAKKHPKSRFVPDARVALGELYFGRDMLEDAAAQYGAVAKRHGDHALATFARYKLGWTLYRMQRYDEAIVELRGAIDDEEKAGATPRFPVRDQALADLIVVWAERPEGWRDAAAYYERKGGDAMVRRELHRFGRWLVTQGKGDDVVALLAWLVARDPTRAETIEYDSLRWTVAERARKVERAEDEARRILEFYAAGGGWDRAEGRAAAARAAATALAERAILFVATLRHETAQRTGDVGSYRAAAEHYATYLARFPGGERRATTTFRMGEARFQLGDRLAAGDAYLAASPLLARAGDAALAEEAGYKAVYSFAEAAREQGLADDATCPPDDPNAPPPEPRPFGEAERRLVDAVDRFTTAFPSSKDWADVALLAARVRWLRFEFGAAAKQFVAIVDRFPRSAAAGDAAALALDCFNRARDWPSLVAWARRMIAERRFDQFDERALREVISGASAQAAATLEKQGDPAGAARVLVAVVDDNPRSGRAPERLLAAATLFRRAGELNAAEGLYRRILERHEKAPQSGRAAFALGALREARGDLAGAADAFERAASAVAADAGKPDDGEAADALYNAAVLRETLGEGKRAAALFDRYARELAGSDDAPEIALRAAEVLERTGERDAALARYLELEKKWPRATPATHAEASARACELLARKLFLERGAADRRHGGGSISAADRKRVKSRCDGALAAARKAGASPGSPAAAAAARAQWVLAEIAAAEMDAVRLELPEATLSRRMAEKTARFAECTSAYLAVADWGVASWGARGIVGLGHAYQRFAAALRGAPEPHGLAGDDLLTYRAEIGDRASRLEENALELFGRVGDLAAEGTITSATGDAAAARRALDSTQDPWLGGAPPRVDVPTAVGGDPWGR